jgi:hypothetical protein
MRILSFLKIDFKLILLFLITTNTFAQDGKIAVSQDARFEQLLNEKRKMNSSITLSDRYKIQVFSGDSETSKKSLQEY